MAKQLFPDGTEVVDFYVRAVKTGPFVFVSGTTSLDSKGRVQGRDAAEQTTIPMRKIASTSSGRIAWNSVLDSNAVRAGSP